MIFIQAVSVSAMRMITVKDREDRYSVIQESFFFIVPFTLKENWMYRLRNVRCLYFCHGCTQAAGWLLSDTLTFLFLAFILVD